MVTCVPHDNFINIVVLVSSVTSLFMTKDTRGRVGKPIIEKAVRDPSSRVALKQLVSDSWNRLIASLIILRRTSVIRKNYWQVKHTNSFNFNIYITSRLWQNTICRLKIVILNESKWFDPQHLVCDRAIDNQVWVESFILLHIILLWKSIFWFRSLTFFL